jgi:biopolymer transport protein ExbB
MEPVDLGLLKGTHLKNSLPSLFQGHHRQKRNIINKDVRRKENEMKKAIALLIAGIILALGPIWGILGTIIGMIGAFGNLAEKTGEAKAEALASNISFSLYTTVAGFIMCPVGILLLVLSIIWIVKIKKK